MTRWLVEKGWILVAIAIAFAVVMAVLFSSKRVQANKAESTATSWAESLGMTVDHASCANLDTNSDNYVSCTLRVHSGSDPVETWFVECPSYWTSFLNDGCRMQRIAR